MHKMITVEPGIANRNDEDTAGTEAVCPNLKECSAQGVTYYTFSNSGPPCLAVDPG